MFYECVNYSYFKNILLYSTCRGSKSYNCIWYSKCIFHEIKPAA